MHAPLAIRVTLTTCAALLLAAPPAISASERDPVESNVDDPVTAQQGTAPAGGAGAAEVTRRPVDPELYRAEKEQASSTPASRGVLAPGPSPTRATQTALFEGLNRLTGGNGSTIFAPPDTIVGRSPTTTLEAVNSGIRLFNNSNAVIGTMNLNSFFSASTADGFIFDPKVYFDRNAANPRYVVVALQKRGDNDTVATNNLSRIRLAISRSANPTSLAASQWCRYNLEGRRNVGTANESWADYPGLGAGRDALLISVNQFRFTPPRPFTFAIVHAIRKVAAYNNAAACPSLSRFTFQPSATLGDGTTFTLQPAQHYTNPSSFTGTTNPAYLVSNSTSSNVYSVWRVRNVAGAPTISSTATRANVTNTFTLATPPDARQPGTSFLLDSGDRRVTQTGARGNVLNHVSANACQFTSGTPNESCWLYTRTTVGQNAAGNVSAALNEQRLTGFGDNTFSYWPGVAVNPAGQVTTPVQFSSSATFLSGRALFKNFNAAYSQTFAFAPGTCAQTNTNRTGDYTGAQADPSSSAMWVAAERATAVAGLSGCNWSTRVARITP